jgi:uncharacterized protein YunC (DUF1805 family)
MKRDFLAPGPVINVECQEECADARINVAHVESVNQVVVAEVVEVVEAVHLAPLSPLAHA